MALGTRRPSLPQQPIFTGVSVTQPWETDPLPVTAEPATVRWFARALYPGAMPTELAAYPIAQVAQLAPPPPDATYTLERLTIGNIAGVAVTVHVGPSVRLDTTVDTIGGAISGIFVSADGSSAPRIGPGESLYVVWHSATALNQSQAWARAQVRLDQ